jgi:sugar/nucleoside kinase (ribokinase family)
MFNNAKQFFTFLEKFLYFGQVYKIRIRMKILGLGNALVDVLIRLSNEEILKQLSLPKGSMQLIESVNIPEINKYIDHLPVEMVSGGSAANTIHSLANLGVNCGYIGKTGSDEFGDFYDTDLKKAGVLSMLYRSKIPTGRAFTFITPDGERTFATYLGAAVELLADDISVELFKDFDLLHIEGYLVYNTMLIEKALSLAKKLNLMVSLDLSSYNVVEANHSFLKKTIPDFVNILFANEEESKAYTQKNPPEALVEIAEECEIAVVKTGKEGAFIKAGKEIVKIAAIPANVKDTTGAGDQFAAGFLYGLSQKLELEKCGKLGALLAGKVIENVGARIPSNQWISIRETVKGIIS